MRRSFRDQPWTLGSLFFLLLALLTTLLCANLDPRVAGLLRNTSVLITGAVLLAVPLGTLIAVILAKTDAPGRLPVAACLTASLLLPLYLHAAAWDAGFGMQGWYTQWTNPRLAVAPLLSGWFGVVWIHAIASLPWVVLIVTVGLRLVEPQLEEDAMLHASAIHVLTRVSLVRATPAVLASAVWVAVIAAGEMSVTDLFQIRTFAEEVYTQAALGTLAVGDTENLAVPSAATADAPANADETTVNLFSWGLWIGLALSVLLTMTVLIALRRFHVFSLEPASRAVWSAPLGRGRVAASLVIWMCLLLVVGIPLVNLTYKAGVDVTSIAEEHTRSWSPSKAARLVAAAPWVHRRELWQSSTVGVAAATAAVMVALPISWSLRAGLQTPWLRLCLTGFCLTLPGPILGILTIRCLNWPPDSPLAGVTWLYDHTQIAPWLVQTIRAFPVAVIILWPAFATLPQATLDSAKSEGAGLWRRILWVALPQRWAAVSAAWLVALAVAMGELAATVLVIPPGPTTVPIRVFSLLHYGVEDRLASICLFQFGSIAALTAVAATILVRQQRRS